MAIKALLTAVSYYDNYQDLPLCRNDLYAVQRALINGLNVDINNIKLLGQTGLIKQSNFLNTLVETICKCNENDTFIFYFSGHGGRNIIACSDGLINLQSIIDTLDKIKVKNKIIILDCCYSGGFNLTSPTEINSIEDLVGHGCAVMASCGANELSGFNPDEALSTYTSFLCDALSCKFIIRKGKKSLEAINEALFRYIMNWNCRNTDKIQQPIFRSNMAGTIFFDVEDYIPYQVERFYLETEKYIIYSVKSIPANIRRLSVKVILRYKYTVEEIADIVSEINSKVRFCNVYSNNQEELRFKNQPAQIIWCYLGQDEEDMVNCNYACRTTWTSHTQDRSYWYSNSGTIINDICLVFNSSYEMLKEMMKPTIDKDEFIKQVRECSIQLIDVAEKYIIQFREFLNGVISETELMEAVNPLNIEITNLYFYQTNLPVPPKELHNWFKIHCKIATTIHDFSLYYDKKNIDTWSAENRKWLMTNSLKRYEQELEELKQADKTIS